MPNLVCPIRGELQAEYFSADQMTVSEEARRIDCINFLLSKNYPREHIQCETTIIRNLGHGGRNSLRADITIYDTPVALLPRGEDNSNHIVLVAEIKRESKSREDAIRHQLKPALRQIDRPTVYGVYWDDVHRILYIKQTINNEVKIEDDVLGNIPEYKHPYRYKPLCWDNLIEPEDISATLMLIANRLRSNHINDETTRYRETVKLLLARYIDERESKESGEPLQLQVIPGGDPSFFNRVNAVYEKTARFYARAKSIFSGGASVIDEKPLREMISTIQGLRLLESSNDSMQQVFMTFVPAVFKKDLDQYFTPLTLVEAMVEILRPGPNDKVADPAMGTADFLTATMSYRMRQGDGQIVSRVYGMDKDPQAYELAVINMILNKDGQTYFYNIDSIEHHDKHAGEIDVALCNPPFGSRTVEPRREVLANYDLGHLWENEDGVWRKTDTVLDSQQLGILFIERCYKLLGEGGRIGIILPEGYLCTASYGYVREWIISHFQIMGLVELPRRIFLKSEADLRSNILFAVKRKAPGTSYPIHTELVRKVGYKLGKGFYRILLRDQETGLEVRDEHNRPIIDTDFRRVKANFARFFQGVRQGGFNDWPGATAEDISNHPVLDMKPRRLSSRALANLREIKEGRFVRLGDIAHLLEDTELFSDKHKESDNIYLIEGQDIRAVEGMVVLKDSEKRWQIEVRKTSKGYPVRYGDIVVGLVRPERRNIGLYTYELEGVYGSPDGVAVIRGRPDLSETYPIEWIFQALRTERCRIQFWTGSGGTSYGKLTLDQIREVLIPVPEQQEIDKIARTVREWSQSVADVTRQFNKIWADQDRTVILNSPVIGLEGGTISTGDDEEDD